MKRPSTMNLDRNIPPLILWDGGSNIFLQLMLSDALIVKRLVI